MRVHKISSGAWLRYHGDVQHDEGRPSGYSLLGRASHTHGHESEAIGPRPWARARGSHFSSKQRIVCVGPTAVRRAASVPLLWSPPGHTKIPWLPWRKCHGTHASGKSTGEPTSGLTRHSVRDSFIFYRCRGSMKICVVVGSECRVLYLVCSMRC